MKKTVLLIAVLSLILFSSCRDSDVIVVDNSLATIKVYNVGDIDFKLFIDTADDSQTDILNAGQNGTYELRWNDRGTLKVIMMARELEGGDTQTRTFYLIDGDFEQWEVGWVYENGRKSHRKIMRRTARTNVKQNSENVK